MVACAVAAVGAALGLAWAAAGPLTAAPLTPGVLAPHQPSQSRRPSPPSPSRPCGTRTGKPVVDKVLLIWEENHSYSSVIGSPDAPELNRLAAKCGVATRYDSLTHPSLPNYMEMTSGRSFAFPPWNFDCDPEGTCVTSARSIFSELGAAGKQWRSYVEAMGHDCGLVSYGEYAAKHNPAVYYTSARHECEEWDQPMGSRSSGAMHRALASGPSAALTTVTPDLLDDMHDGTVAEADNWVAGWLPQIVGSPAYRSGHLAVLIAWDEGAGSGNVPSHVPLIVMSASTPAGTRSAGAFNDYSVLRTISQLTGVAGLGKASSAASLVGPFHL